ncbi:coiled-coil domain-containing protein 6 isoform X1 [Lepeophtheirus salmonis]|uniref:coiled-coil domain-containing protein 6 isoform X1 n=1 Tax=Lepeophtheirus salmonis TaxID=72036 RepID=UPI001AE909ED|nr:coiled-coil domain-containing protein 6-like [Lepeophtheirus salmonis]
MEHLVMRNESLVQENTVLKVEIETYKWKIKALIEENRELRQASVHIQAKAEQEEEFISNTLLKKIQALKKEKENLALNYEQEEECLTNDLSRKLNQLRQEKVQLEHTLEQEQECLVNKLMRKIEKLENETTSKQNNLETLRREKIELENTLEQEQEALVNKLWKRMDRLETEKRSLQLKLDQPVSELKSLQNISDEIRNKADSLSNNIHALREECARLKQQLNVGKLEHERKMAEYAKEEKEVRDENLRLQRRLQLEVERKETFRRHVSETESDLEMEEERVYNEMTCGVPSLVASSSSSMSHINLAQYRNCSHFSPVPSSNFSSCTNTVMNVSSASQRSISPGGNKVQQGRQNGSVGHRRIGSERFVKPQAPTSLVTSLPSCLSEENKQPSVMDLSDTVLK